MVPNDRRARLNQSSDNVPGSPRDYERTSTFSEKLWWCPSLSLRHEYSTTIGSQDPICNRSCNCPPLRTAWALQRISRFALLPSVGLGRNFPPVSTLWHMNPERSPTSGMTKNSCNSWELRKARISVVWGDSSPHNSEINDVRMSCSFRLITKDFKWIPDSLFPTASGLDISWFLWSHAAAICRTDWGDVSLRPDSSKKSRMIWWSRSRKLLEVARNALLGYFLRLPKTYL